MQHLPASYLIVIVIYLPVVFVASFYFFKKASELSPGHHCSLQGINPAIRPFQQHLFFVTNSSAALLQRNMELIGVPPSSATAPFTAWGKSIYFTLPIVVMVKQAAVSWYLPCQDDGNQYQGGSYEKIKSYKIV